MTQLTFSPLLRWRLLLGEASKNCLGDLTDEAAQADRALSWLYDRDSERAEREERSADLSESVLSVPQWINSIHELFPEEVIERLECDAVERYGIDEVVTNLDVLERIEPSEALLRAVLQTKHLMNPDVLAAARKLIAKVVEELMNRLRTEIQQTFSGTRDRRRRSRHKIASNFDFKRTVANNLHRYHPEKRRLYLETAFFSSRSKRHLEAWDVILLIDQSGSMVDSVIHSAVMAACLWNLPGMRTRLVAFDTEVVDLTQDVTDPVELLMKVQLGGGTDIARAVAYAQSLVSNPTRTLIILVSDFYEGGSEYDLVRRVKTLVESGCKVLGLAALNTQAKPEYSRDMAARLVQVGMPVGAMTPGQLASWLFEKMQG